MLTIRLNFKGSEHVVLDVPNIQRLRPLTTHHSHNLWQGLLLLVDFIQEEESEARAWICDECLQAL